MRTFTVFVPAPDASGLTGIRRGSGIVGQLPNPWAPVQLQEALEGGPRVTTRVPRPYVRIDYEGDLYNASNVVTFADRVRRAYGRQVENYPTVARMVVLQDDLWPVGWFDPAAGLVHCTDPDRLAEWLGVDELHSKQLRCTS